VLIGTILTIVVQSSSAAMAITLVLCNQGVIPLEVAAAIVLGENIGTTITANIAAAVANIHAKRAAIAHLIFNVFGVVWVIVFFEPFLNLIEVMWIPFHNILQSINPEFVKGETEMQLSLFHTTFNIVNSLLLIWFVNKIASLVTKIIPSKGDDEEYSLEHISTGIMSTPELSIIEAQKEVAKFGEIVKKMNGFLKGLLTEQEPKVVSKTLARIKKYEDITDRMEQDVADYLSKTAEGEMSEGSSLKVRGMLSIVGDLERIGDIYYQMSKGMERKIESKVYFTPEQRKNILDMFDMVEEALGKMCENLSDSYSSVSMVEAKELEMALNKYRKAIRKEHFVSLEKGEYNFQSAAIYADLFNSLEKVGDHVINVTEGITGEH
jgi:phosphate:Na+ symporter